MVTMRVARSEAGRFGQSSTSVTLLKFLLGGKEGCCTQGNSGQQKGDPTYYLLSFHLYRITSLRAFNLKATPAPSLFAPVPFDEFVGDLNLLKLLRCQFGYLRGQGRHSVGVILPA